MLNERTFFPEYVALRITFNGRLLFYFAFSGAAEHVHPYLKQPAVRVIKQRVTMHCAVIKASLASLSAVRIVIPPLIFYDTFAPARWKLLHSRW